MSKENLSHWEDQWKTFTEFIPTRQEKEKESEVDDTTVPDTRKSKVDNKYRF